MAKIAAVLSSSLAKKYTMALSGLFLIVFLLEHLYTNLLLYAGDGGIKFNEASHEMTSSLFIRIVEFVLFAALILHVVQATLLTQQNAKARPIKYAVSAVNETSNWFSRNMGLTGSLILFFIVVHLYNFFVPYRITGEVGDGQEYTLAQCVVAALRNEVYAGIYLVSVIFLGFHLNHGFQSAFQTLGFSNKTYAPLLKMAGTGLALIFTLGYGSFPILVYTGILGCDILPQ
jgi:succinate dehydrogenase / fumarate reductase cytochrome b subunit